MIDKTHLQRVKLFATATPLEDLVTVLLTTARVQRVCFEHSR